MKIKILTIICMLIIGNNLSAQITGTKFAPDGTRWSMADEFMTCINCYNYYYGNIMMNGDTVINNKYCQKMFHSNNQNFDTTCMNYINYSYYNNGQFYVDSVLVFDFNLNVGDTFSFFVAYGPCQNYNEIYQIVVDSVTSMFYGSKWRKEIIFKENPDFYIPKIKWVEGIGDIGYGIPTSGINFYGQIAMYYCLEGYEKLNCFQEPGCSAYGNACYNASCTVGLSSINDERKISCFPNPAKDEFTIEYTGNTTKKEMLVELYNIYGILIKQTQSPNQSKITINTKDFPAGIYFYRVKMGDDLIGGGKIVVNE